MGFGVDIARRQNGLMQFFQVSEGFEDDEIDAAFDQGGNLLAEGVAGFLKGGFAQRLNADAQGPDRAAYPNVKTLGGFARHVGSGEIDVADFVGDAVAAKAKGVCPESIGFDDLRAGLQIFVMDGANQIGLRQVQFVVTAVDEDALGVQQGAHGAVAQDRGILQTL